MRTKTRIAPVLLRLLSVAVPVGIGVLVSHLVRGLPFALGLAVTFGTGIGLYALLDAKLVRPAVAED